MKTTALALVDHWTWAAEKGLMKINTAKAYRAACAQILSVLDAWEIQDVRAMNLEDVFQRFQNKRGKDFTPESLDTYRKRFTVAVRSFLDYASNPASWKAPVKNREPRNTSRRQPLPAPSRAALVATVPDLTAKSQTREDRRLIDYLFPLREGQVIHLQLPADLQAAEVRRLSAFLASLALDFEDQR